MLVSKLSDNTKDYLDNFFGILATMEQKMCSVSATDSISQIYINQMTPHMEAGVAMAKNILKFTTNPQIESLAKDIQDDQSLGISTLRDIYENCSKTKNSPRDVGLFMNESMKIITKMIATMKNSKTTNNLDADFLSSMIPHHIGAIELNKLALQFDLCPDLNAFAQNEIDFKTRQLQQMKNLLSQM